MIKKISALTLSFLLAVSCLASCSNSSSSESVATSAADSSASSTDSAGGDDSNTDDSSDAEEVIPEPSLTIDGKKVDTDGLVMLTIEGHDVSFDVFRYYYAYVLSVYGLTPDTVTEDLFPDLLTNTVNQIKQEYVTYKIADEEKIELDDDDNKAIEDNITQLKANYESEEAFLDGMKKYYLNLDVLTQMQQMSKLYEKVYDKALTNGGKYAMSDDDFKKVIQDKKEYARAIHILIPYYSQAELDDETAKTYESLDDLSQKNSIKQSAYSQLDADAQKECQEKAKKLADEVLQKAKDGEDFRALIDEYGWDAGMESDLYKEGYYVRPESSFVQEFKDALFELKENEFTQELVENKNFGYFIIKRLPIDMDYVEENKEALMTDYNKVRVKQLYADLMEKLDVKFSDEYEKLAYNSIT